MNLVTVQDELFESFSSCRWIMLHHQFQMIIFICLPRLLTRFFICGIFFQVLKLRFPKDLRLQEVRRLLQSARPVVIAIKQRPEVSDHDFIEEQERVLLNTCVRTMALPIGRWLHSFYCWLMIFKELLTSNCSLNT